MIRWLHISDLHLNSKGASTAMLRDELPLFLSEQEMRCDYVFCTGDIRTADEKPCVYTDDMADFLKTICCAVGVDTKRLYIVPGNHDIDRDLPNRVAAIKRIMYRPEWVGYYDAKSGVINETDMEGIMEGESDFITFLKKIYPPDRISQYGNPEKPHFNIETDDFNILHLDTTIAYAQGQEKTDLIVGTRALYNVVRELNPNKPTLLLTHYPFTALQQDEKKMLSIMLQKHNVRLWLAGHEHDQLLQKEHYLHSLQAGELRDERGCNATFLVGEYDEKTHYCCIKAYTWFDEGWAQYPYVDLDNKPHTERYECELTSKLEAIKPRTTVKAAEANKEYYYRLPQKVEKSLLPAIECGGAEREFDELLKETWNTDTPHVIMLADGGMGKTTLLLNYCQTTDNLVLYIPAERLAALKLTIERYCIDAVYDGDEGLFRKKLYSRDKEPGITLFVDGLNELDETIDINEYDDETRKNIEQYKKWYENAVKCQEAIRDLKLELKDLYSSQFKNIITTWENALQNLEQTADKVKSLITRREDFASDYVQMSLSRDASNANIKSYLALINNLSDQRSKRQSELAKLTDKLASGTTKGIVAKGSEEYYKLLKDIQEVEDEINDLNEDIIKVSNSISKEYVKVFNSIYDEYKNKLSLSEHLSKEYNNYLDIAEAKGLKTSSVYYSKLKSIAESNAKNASQLAKDLQKQLTKAVGTGEIRRGSEAWYEMTERINDAVEAEQEAIEKAQEYANKVREIKWDKFDYLQNSISDIREEAEFLIDLFEDSVIFEDNGAINDNGKAILGLHAMNYDVAMNQADRYANEIIRLNSEIANDSSNSDLLERRKELLKAQRESIKAAEDEKHSIKSLISDGFKKELDYLDDIIEKYKDALDNQKDLYDYQKNIQKQTSEISSLQKQLWRMLMTLQKKLAQRFKRLVSS